MCKLKKEVKTYFPTAPECLIYFRGQDTIKAAGCNLNYLCLIKLNKQDKVMWLNYNVKLEKQLPTSELWLRLLNKQVFLSCCCCYCDCSAEMDLLMTGRADNQSDTAGMDIDLTTPPPGPPPLLTPAGRLFNWLRGHRFNTGTSRNHADFSTISNQ